MTGAVFGVLALWVLFAGPHAVLSSQRLRPRLVAQLGEPGFPLFAWLGCAHQDRRKRVTQPGYADWIDATPFLPFAGAGALRGLRELSPLVVVAGVALTVALRLLHGPLFR